MASHQDWTPVVWAKRESYKGAHKEAALNKARRAGEDIATEKKFLGGQNRSSKAYIPTNAAKIENETENFRIERIEFHFRQALQKARLAKGLTQQSLARLINEPEAIVKEYENGSAIPNGSILQKLSKALGTQLPSAKASKAKKIVE
ncbi:multiprotein bridging factor type 1, putative [Babesia bigemina]|uniref:Multiprotein bridging factor type 1, putative n=1 Tax=Babesia bigemina TaxID=5866 RepID=A0A061DBE0_BABBI|nr:multiprotein bridging factor type 1, putative [Babesia bigemina]CDR96219.1 multiprotein bridging factor type 1, putative [Babesia bigemina]|eukprot:XP_012768405.1 multiprotein bridging factor type 1, putative [Babesia bigemina]